MTPGKDRRVTAKWHQTRNFAALMVLLLLLVLALRVLTLNPLVIDVDEAWFAVSGAVMRDPWDFFSVAPDNKPPGTVWFYWLVGHLTDSGTDPRPARAVYFALLGVAAWGVARLIARLRPGRGVLVAVLFFIAVALPSPKQFATTSEGLMLPLLCICAVALSARKPRLSHAMVAGFCLGASMLVKQTGVFFFVPALVVVLWRRRQKSFSTAAAAIFLGTTIFLVSAAVAKLGAGQFWTWTVFYPSVHLRPVRAELFTANQDFLVNALIFGVALFPLLIAAASGFAALWTQAVTRDAAMGLALWIMGAITATAVGQGLFFHYFVYLVPPVVALAACAGRRCLSPARLCWPVGIYAAVAALAAIPAFGAFWGADLTYYRKMGDAIRALTAPSERIFVWGGNALPHVTGSRLSATRFVSARFTAPPYAVPETLAVFRSDFMKDPPLLLVDTHERGDSRFNAPIESLPWLKLILERDYVVSEAQSMPWAKFYLRAGPRAELRGKRILASSGRSQDHSSVYSVLEEEARANPARFALSVLSNWRNARTLEKLLRDWEGLRELSRTAWGASEESELSSRKSRLARAIERQVACVIYRGPGRRCAVRDGSRLADLEAEELRRQFERARAVPPLALESPLWWVSYALVRLQPVALRTDSPARHKL